MSIHVFSENEAFRCRIYGRKERKKDQYQYCKTKNELKSFLLSFPDAPVNNINDFIEALVKLGA